MPMGKPSQAKGARVRDCDRLKGQDCGVKKYAAKKSFCERIIIPITLVCQYVRMVHRRSVRSGFLPAQSGFFRLNFYSGPIPITAYLILTIEYLLLLAPTVRRRNSELSEASWRSTRTVRGPKYLRKEVFSIARLKGVRNIFEVEVFPGS